MPLAFATGINTSLPALMSATVTVWPAPTAAPLFVRLPAPGSVAIRTAIRLWAGLSLPSLKPKSAALKVYAVSSFVVTVLSVPAGASFTAVTFTVSVLAEASRSMPPLAVPPAS